MFRNTIGEGKSGWRIWKYSSRNSLQTTTLLMPIEFKFDACIGGARDEEKAELRTYFFCAWWFWSMGWKTNVRNYSIFERKSRNGQSSCFSISNWTELDVWVIWQEQIEIPSIYFSHKRKVFLRDGMIWISFSICTKKKKKRNWRTNCSF
jgi:sulfate adenylyltransferase subunit 2